MDLLVDVLLLLAAVMLVDRSNSDRDEVWQLCLRILAVMSVLAVITSDRGLPLAVLLLIFALWLPGAAQLEKALDAALQNLEGSREKARRGPPA
ncbi:MAG: hypothetical protein ACK522_07020 [Synechococcaceae cyanobacterium]|jgi:hypothetical protein